MPAVESKGARFISRLNGIFKIAIAVINLLVILFSLALASFGIYIQAGNWGSRPGTFISNTGIGFIVFGFGVVVMSIASCYGLVQSSSRKSEDGTLSFWTWRRILLSYHMLLLCAIVFELFIIGSTLNIVGSLQTISSAFAAGQNTPPYTRFEKKISSAFDSVFFAAVENCSSKLDWVWSWIAKHCPSSLSESSCSQCVMMNGICGANIFSCAYSSYPSYSASCPYEICRQGAVSYFVGTFRIVANVLIAFCVLHGIKMFLNGAIVCYRPRASTYEILKKTGAISENTKRANLHLTSGKYSSMSIGGDEQDV